VTGTPAEAKERAIRSLRAWCLVHPACLRFFYIRNCVALEYPRGCRTGIDVAHSLKPTATLSALSSSLKPHEAMGMANSQSPLCCLEAARNEARRCVEVRLASICALSSSTPGRSQKGCLVGKMYGTAPNFADQADRYAWRDSLSDLTQSVRMSSWIDSYR